MKSDADIFYGNSDRHAAPDPDEKSINPASHYPDTGRKRETETLIGAARKSDVAVFYPDSAGRPRVKAELAFNLGRIADHRSLSAIQRGQLADRHTDWFGVLASDRRQKAHDVFTRYVLRPATSEEHDRWTEQSNAYLRETYGERADAVRAKMADLVKADPELAKEMNESGAGSHPAVVEAFAEAAARALKP